MTNKSMRRGQTIQPFGIGSIVDINGEGFVVKDLSKWTSLPGKRLKLQRLEEMICSKHLRSFSDNQTNRENLPVTRFPKWHHCSSCKRLYCVDFSFVGRYFRDTNDSPCCPEKGCDSQPLSPMRFIAYCDRGHLTEIAWHAWAHQKEPQATRGHCVVKDRLYFVSTGKSGGDFNQMIVGCRECGAENNLSEIINPRPKRNVVQAWEQDCCGKQPWMKRAEARECDQFMRIEPRGSSSIYRGKVLSALDIESIDTPVENDVNYQEFDQFIEEFKETHPSPELRKAELRKGVDGQYFVRIRNMSRRAGITIEDGRDYLLDKSLPGPDDIVGNGKSQGLPSDAQEQLLKGELTVFRSGRNVDSKNLQLKFVTAQNAQSPFVSRLFSSICQVRRLREIRALVGFTRGKGLEEVPVDLGGIQDWVPAVEAFGEGIYFELNERTLNGYLATFAAALDQTVKGQTLALQKLKEEYPVDIPDGPLFILAHTLSHLLIRQLTFNSGYSSSALRERIFVDPGSRYAGILIYTTDSDTEGTMGGLVDQARIDYVSSVIDECAEGAIWCSADPVCRETENQGFAGLNRSACHCCSLVSETSCLYQNAMLNRLTLGGMGAERGELKGLFNFIREKI